MPALPTEIKAQILADVSSQTGSATPILDILHLSSVNRTFRSLYNDNRNELLLPAMQLSYGPDVYKYALALVLITNESYCTCSARGPKFVTLSEDDINDVLDDFFEGKLPYRTLEVADLRAMQRIQRITLKEGQEPHDQIKYLIAAIVRFCRASWDEFDRPRPVSKLTDSLFQMAPDGFRYSGERDPADLMGDWTTAWYEAMAVRAKRHFGDEPEWTVLDFHAVYLDERNPAYWFNYVLYGGVERNWERKDCDRRERVLLDKFPEAHKDL